MKSIVVDIECEIRDETDSAVNIFDGETSCWLLKRQIEIERPRQGRTAPTVVTMPEWLAEEKGLV